MVLAAWFACNDILNQCRVIVLEVGLDATKLNKNQVWILRISKIDFNCKVHWIKKDHKEAIIFLLKTGRRTDRVIRRC